MEASPDPVAGVAIGRLSIGAKLALRYTLATFATISVLGAFVYTQVAERVNREAALVLDVQLQDLVDAFESQSREHPREFVLGWFDGQMRKSVGESAPDLGLGIELLDPDGVPLLEQGSLAGPGPAPLRDPVSGGVSARLREVYLGDGYPHLMKSSPVHDGILQVAIDTRRFAENVHEIRRVFLLSLPILLGTTGLLGWALARASLRPIGRIIGTARRIGGSNLRESLPSTGSGDELDQLAATLNEMIGRIRRSMERERRFTGNAAHQLLTPITGMRNQLEVTLDHPRTPEEYHAALVDVLDEANRMATLVEALLRLARSEGGIDPARWQSHAVGPLLATVVEFFQPLAEEQGVALVLDEVPAVRVQGDGSWLVQLFSNLVSNGIKFTPAGGRVELSAKCVGDTLEVRVRDTGTGIPPDQVHAIFERFQRGTPVPDRPGTGLGLAIAREIARAHGGEIAVESAAPGSCFVVTLYLAPPGPAALSAAALERSVAGVGVTDREGA